MVDVPTDFFHGHFNYLKIAIFYFGNFPKIREETPGNCFPREEIFPGTSQQNHQLNPIGPLFEIPLGIHVAGFLMDALLKITPSIYVFCVLKM